MNTLSLPHVLAGGGGGTETQVLHWAKTFGTDNIMVVDSADLQSRQKETLEVGLNLPFEFGAVDFELQ